MRIQRPLLRLMSPRLLSAWLLIAASLWAAGAAAGSPTRQEVASKSAALALPFIENRGQVDERVGFYARTFGGTVFVSRAGEIVYSLPRAGAEGDTPRPSLTLREVLVGARIATVRGEGPAAVRVSSFRGRDRSKWRTALPAYDAVSLGEVYPGIDLRLQARGHNVEKLFQVRPGATPGAVRLRVEGARRLSVAEGGELVAVTELGPVTFTRPVAFQESEGRRVHVAVRYQVHSDGGSYGFEVGDYDATRSLVIDPLLASTKVGGIADDVAHAIAVGGRDPDRGGPLVVITGCAQHPRQLGGTPTEDAFYPTTLSAYDRSQSNDQKDAFVTALSGDLATLRGSTFLGAGGAAAGSRSSTGGSCGHAVTMTDDGVYGPAAIYVAGMTESAEFPTTVGAYDRTLNDQRLPRGAGRCQGALGVGVGRRGDAFISKFTGNTSILAAAELSILAGSTFLGGCASDVPWALALDGSGNVFVAGYTYSSDFPTTPGAYGEAPGGEVDAFTAKLDGDLASLLASTFLGGRRNDFALGLALDGRGDVYVTGYTRSDGFPTTPGAYDTTYNGGLDAFVSKLSPDLAAIGID